MVDELREMNATKDVLRLYPTIMTSKNWSEVSRLAKSGDVDGAKALAAKSEVSKVVRSRNIIARRHAIERTEFLARIITAQKALKMMLDHYSNKVATAIEDKGHKLSNLKRINEIIHDQTVLLRASLRIWLGAAIRDSAKMGFRHIGDALLPIFKHNQESIEREIIADRALFEASLVFGIKHNIANSRTSVVLTADQLANKAASIVRNITKKNIAGSGLRPSDRIWDLTTRAEMDLKRIVANGIGQSENPVVIARRIKKYVSPEKIDPDELGVEPGPGVYRSPFKNAYRLAKTEMNRTYVKASVQFAKDKPWLADKGDILLSPLHEDEDECDQIVADGPYTPDEADSLIPAHPHCGCRFVPSIKPEYLGEEEDAA